MSKKKNSRHSREGGNPDESCYKKCREFYTPSDIKCVLIAESPPAKGTYFYFSDGKVTENLFSAVMKALYKKVPFTKKEGLQRFKDDGYILVDSIYKPINRLIKKKKKDAIRENLPYLLKDLKDLEIKKKIPIILISRNVLNIVEPKLIEMGYNVLNKGKLVPFPAYHHKKRFIKEFKNFIRKLK